ncbi:MAG: PIN/TRAM domain-containing protein [Planctomycetota bacterium]
MVIHLVRALFLLVVLAFTIPYALSERVTQEGPQYVTLYIIVPVLLAFGLVMVDMFWRKKRLEALSGLFFGVLAGLVIAYLLRHITTMIGVAVAGVDETDPVLQLVKVLVGAAAVFLCVSFVLQTKDDFRFVIPYVEFSRHAKGPRPFLLDTSVIIDGRIADITETKILESEIIVPRFILAELQAIADSDNKLRRNRGRRGLDVLNRLQGSDKIDVRIYDKHIAAVDDESEVDAKLVALGEHLNGRVMTNDYNLNKVAQLRGVEVININDLANALKPVVLPGEGLRVKIIKPGEEPGQGVGYLDDGTMVVAEQGRDHVGQEVMITVTSVIQTSAGRMIFGKLDSRSV